MTQELDDRLCQKYPKIFVNRYGDMKTTAMCWGFDCDDGWYNIIDLLCSNLQWNTDHNNKDYVIENKLLRNFISLLQNLSYKIPCHYNLKHKKQINPLTIIRRSLLGLIHEWRSKQKFIYIESNRYPQIIAAQIKEKFGGLRFYVEGASDQQYAVISFVESLSYHVCEKCGTMKNIGRTKGWIKTLCKGCAFPDPNWKLLEDEQNDIKSTT
jgi:hypothetical protein